MSSFDYEKTCERVRSEMNSFQTEKRASGLKLGIHAFLISHLLATNFIQLLFFLSAKKCVKAVNGTTHLTLIFEAIPKHQLASLTELPNKKCGKEVVRVSQEWTDRGSDRLKLKMCQRTNDVTR